MDDKKQIRNFLLQDAIISYETNLTLDDDINYFIDKLSNYLPFFVDLSSIRRQALIYICFRSGIKGLITCSSFIIALAKGDFVKAADELLETTFAKYAKDKAILLANIIRAG